MSPARPETTHNEGAFTAASERRVPSCGFIISSGNGTANIAPSGTLCINLPRTATSFSASSSEKTPATQAATYSPRLWPINAAGRTPRRIHNCASAYSMTKSAGCVTDVWRSVASASANLSASG